MQSYISNHKGQNMVSNTSGKKFFILAHILNKRSWRASSGEKQAQLLI